MRVTFLGTGSSHGIPVIGCNCAVCLSSNPKNQRNRTGVWIEGSDGHSTLIDISCEFRISALKYGLKQVDLLLLTHTHSDHISGLDDLRIFSQRSGKGTPIYSDHRSLTDVRDRFSYAFQTNKSYGGGLPQFELNEITTSIQIAGMTITPLPLMHGPEIILGFRINDFAFLTDVSVIPDATLDQMKGLDILAIDCLRPEPHSTHLSFNEALQYAKLINAKRTFFIHMTHELEHEATQALLPKGIFMAYDGLMLETA